MHYDGALQFIPFGELFGGKRQLGRAGQKSELLGEQAVQRGTVARLLDGSQSLEPVRRRAARVAIIVN